MTKVFIQLQTAHEECLQHYCWSESTQDDCWALHKDVCNSSLENVINIDTGGLTGKEMLKLFSIKFVWEECNFPEKQLNWT